MCLGTVDGGGKVGVAIGQRGREEERNVAGVRVRVAGQGVGGKRVQVVGTDSRLGGRGGSRRVAANSGLDDEKHLVPAATGAWAACHGWGGEARCMVFLSLEVAFALMARRHRRHESSPARRGTTASVTGLGLSAARRLGPPVAHLVGERALANHCGAIRH